MPSVADLYGKPSTRAQKYKSTYIDGLASQYEWLLEYYSQDPRKSPEVALYKELIDDARRDVSAIEKSLRDIREKQIDFTTRREEKNAGFRNSAQRIAYTADRADRRTEFTQEQAAKRARAYNARKLSASRAEGRLAPDENLRRAVQDSYTTGAGNVATGFDTLGATIQGSRELPKEESQVDGANWTLYKSYVAAKKQELAADPSFSELTQPQLDQAAEDAVLTTIPEKYKQSVSRHQGKIDAESAAGLPKAEAEVGNLSPGEIERIGGMPVSTLSTAVPESMRTEETRLAADLQAKQDELTKLREQYESAIVGRVQDPVTAARTAFRDAYFPGTRPAFEQNRLLEMAALRTPQERDQLLSAFREFQQTQPTRRPGLLERADLFYRTPGGLLDSLLPGLDADPRARRMPAETALGGEVEDERPRLFAGKEGPRQAGDVIGGVGSPFAQPEVTPDRSFYFEGVSERARPFIGKPIPPDQLEQIRSQPGILQALQDEGLTVDLSDPSNPRYIQLSRVDAVMDGEEAQIPVPEADLAKPVTPRERVEDARFDASIERYRALTRRRALLEQYKEVAAGEQLDIIVRAEGVIDRAIGAQAEALNNYQRGKDQGIDEETMAVLSRNVDASSALADEALAVASEAQMTLDKVLSTETLEDEEARQVRTEVEAAEATPPGRRGAEEYGDLPLDKALDRRAVRKMEEAPTQKSLKQRDTEAKGQAYIEALRLVKQDDGKGFQTLLGTPIGIEVADLYKANKAKGDQTNEQLLSYLAREFPSREDQQKAAQVVFGLDIADIEAEYMGKPEESPLRPLYQQAGIELDAGSTVEEPDDPIAPEATEDE